MQFACRAACSARFLALRATLSAQPRRRRQALRRSGAEGRRATCSKGMHRIDRPPECFDNETLRRGCHSQPRLVANPQYRSGDAPTRHPQSTPQRLPRTRRPMARRRTRTRRTTRSTPRPSRRPTTHRNPHAARTQPPRRSRHHRRISPRPVQHHPRTHLVRPANPRPPRTRTPHPTMGNRTPSLEATTATDCSWTH